MSAPRVTVLFLALQGFVFEASACGRPRRSPPRDHNPPTLKCPSDIRRIADPVQANTAVDWLEPKAYDNEEQRHVSVTRTGRRPGRLFSEGSHVISYSAKDRSGNSATCNFNIQVTVVRCHGWSSPSDGWKICHPSTDMRYGGRCRFGCYPGHDLVGASSTTCRSDGTWTIANQPSCKKKTCIQLLSTADELKISCTDSNYYRSKCTYVCKDGYSVQQGYSKVRVCGAGGDWLGATPTCKDIRPPEFSNCPLVKTVYAEKNKTSAQAYWEIPKATDNSGNVTIKSTSWPTSGTEFEVGEYDVRYIATDSTGNSATCSFKLIVKQILCTEIFPFPYTSVTCPSGRIYGSSCQFACDNGTSSSYPMLTYCEKYGNKYYYGLWDFGDYQPYCERQNNCPDLLAPDNGALACDTWLAGRYCQMMCQESYTVYDRPEIDVHKNLLVCGDSGTWRPSDELPNCNRGIVSRGAVISNDISYGYYSGPCNSAREEIRQHFLASFQNWNSCDPPDCSLGNVKVICGDTSKRDVETILRIQVDLNLATTLTYAEVVAIREIFKQNLTEAQTSGGLDLLVDNVTLAAEVILCGLPVVSCPEGSVPDGVKPLTCVQCGPGFYQDTTFQPQVCRKCEIGSYQTDFGQTSCDLCPPGMTTERTGETECKEACPIGKVSPKGTPPCSPCDIGKYSDVEGTRECTLCPGSKTTHKTGSTSKDECYEFDVVFTGLEEEEFVTPSVSADMTSAENFSVAMWFKCEESCVDVLSITDGREVEFLTIKGGDNVETTIGSTTLSTLNMTLAASFWRYLYVAWSSKSVAVYVDGELVTNSTHILALSQTLNVGFGGPGFVGRVSQLNVFGSATNGPDGKGDSCFSAAEGALVAWRSYANLDGSFVQTRSHCDAFDNCLSSPCHNDGICSDAIDGFTCACADGFAGSDCSINIDDCEVSVCDNEGTCVDGIDGYTCSCPEGFGGDLCEIQVVDGAWGDYGNWSLCSVTCGTGQQVRNRTCDTPEPMNGGKECEGLSFEFKECVMEECVYECDQDPHPIAHGAGNCSWEGDTRRCYPYCDEGYAFESDLYVIPANVHCGPDTGYLWNIRSSDNPKILLPECQEITKGNQNVLYYTADYMDLRELDDAIRNDIQITVMNRANQTSCVAELGRCHVTDCDVTLKGVSDSRWQRSTQCVTFTIAVTCDIISDINECYDLLATVVNELNDFIISLAYTVTYNGVSYDVTANSTSLDGTTVCDSGYVPVFQYCIPCGEGMYQNGDFCERCEVGYYQDEIAQQSCKQCPEDWTTAGLQSRNASWCNVEVPSESDISSTVYAVTAVFTTVCLIVALAVIYKIKMTGTARILTETTDHEDVGGNIELQQGPQGRYKVLTEASTLQVYPSAKKMENAALEETE